MIGCIVAKAGKCRDVALCDENCSKEKSQECEFPKLLNQLIKETVEISMKARDYV